MHKNQQLTKGTVRIVKRGGFTRTLLIFLRFARVAVYFVCNDVVCTQDKHRSFSSTQRKLRVCGFTLIELMVTVSIISLLASIVLTSINDARAQARDVQRINDAKSIQNALELYRAEYGVLPGGEEFYQGIGCPDETENSLELLLQSLVDEGFLSQIPRDLFFDTAQASDEPPYCYHLAIDTIGAGVLQAGLCGGPSGQFYDYLIVFSTEKTQFSIPKFVLENFAGRGHCLAF